MGMSCRQSKFKEKLTMLFCAAAVDSRGSISVAAVGEATGVAAVRVAVIADDAVWPALRRTKEGRVPSVTTTGGTGTSLPPPPPPNSTTVSSF